MKFSKIALAVAATLVAGQAFAGITTGQIISARNAGTLDQTWFSGASASAQPTAVAAFSGCTSGSATILTNQSTGNVAGSLGNFLAYACTVGSRTRLVFHTVEGGSFNAFAPHVDGTQLDRLSANWTSCALNGSSYSNTSIPGGSASVYNSCALEGTAAAANGNNLGANGSAVAALKKPEGGLSDVEGATFGVDVSSVGSETPANFGQVFGVAVTPQLYRALQIKQGIYPSTTTFGNAQKNIAGTDATFDPANAPNITSADYAAIVASSGSTKANWIPLLGAAGNNKKIVLQRRVATSGTQASSNAFFLKNPCSNTTGVLGSLPVASIIGGDNNPGAFEISEQSTTGDVKKGLTAAENANNYAIGVVSLENDWRRENAVDRIGYRFVKLDGVHPEAASADGTTFNTTVAGFSASSWTNYVARTTATTGAYQFVMETVAFKKNGISTVGSNLLDLIVARTSNPTTCNLTPRGLYLLPAGGSTCTTVDTATASDLAEVSKVTRSGNSCSPLFY